MDALETEIAAEIDAFFKHSTIQSTDQLMSMLNAYLEGAEPDEPQLARFVWWEIGLRLGVADDIMAYFAHRAHVRQQHIAKLGLPPQAEKSLQSRGVCTIDSLRAMSAKELMSIPKIGTKTARQIQASLKEAL